MKNLKKMIAIGAVVLVVGATSVTALAAFEPGTPAEIVSGLTGQSVEDLIAERSETGETFGTIAEESGVLAQFQSQMLEQKKAVLEERVAEGTMTRERADEILAALENHQADCDGTCTGECIGLGMGAGFGSMNGTRSGGRSGSGLGNGSGSGNGAGLRSGSGNGFGSGNGTGVCTATTGA